MGVLPGTVQTLWALGPPRVSGHILALEPSGQVPFFLIGSMYMMCPQPGAEGRAGHLPLLEALCPNPQQVGNPRALQPLGQDALDTRGTWLRGGRDAHPDSVPH